MKRMEDETRETRTSEAITHLAQAKTPPKGAAGTVCHPPPSPFLSPSLFFLSVASFIPPSVCTFLFLLLFFLTLQVYLRRSSWSNRTRQETVRAEQRRTRHRLTDRHRVFIIKLYSSNPEILYFVFYYLFLCVSLVSSKVTSPGDTL